MSRKKISKISEQHSSANSITVERDSASIIDIDDVSVVYGDTTAIRDVSLCVHAGECVGLIGPNGAGKTTLLRALLGLVQVASGTIRRAPGVRIGYVAQRRIQHVEQIPFSVSEVVRMAGNHALGVHQALERVDMAAFAHSRFDALSGGQQQRVLIARALATQPDILVLDEPLTGVDEVSQRQFADIVTSLHRQGIAILLVSHDIDAVLTQVDRIICINNSVLYDGPPEHFEMDTYMPQLYATRHRLLHHQHGEAND